MRSKAGVRGYVAELDGLRGIAILLVMIHRFYPGASSPWFVEGGWVGVDLFFVVSGFLIAGIVLDTRDEPGYFRNFYARRVLRIFPLYYLLIGAILIVFPATNSGFIETSGSPVWYLVHLGNVPEAVLGKDPAYWLAPVWSLAIEEQFYLTFPLLVWLATRRQLAWCLLGMALLALATRTVSTFAWPENERFQYQFTLCRLDAIAAGCALALLVRWRGFARWQLRLKMWLGVVIAACAGVVLACQLDRTTTFGRTLGYSVVAIGFGALVLRVAMARDQRTTLVLRWAPLRHLGKLCFGLYLLHRPADTLASAAIARTGLPAESLWWMPLKMAVAVGLATLTWHLLEQPFLRLKDRFASRNHPSRHTTGRLVAIALAISLVAGCRRTNAEVEPKPPRDDASLDWPELAPLPDVSTPLPDVPPDTPPTAPQGHVLYPEGRVHSPITADVVGAICELAATSTQWNDVFAKVGDSITATAAFVTCFDDHYDLGSHTALAPSLAHFAAGNAAGKSPFARSSLAARGGWTAHEPLVGTPLPLDREVDAIAPRFASVMFGTNDVRYGRSLWEFAADLWTIVDKLRARGVVPILSTIPSTTDASSDARVPLFNRVVRALAQGRQVPLVDYHLALESLPDRGIAADGIHPSLAPGGACLLTATGLAYGYNTRNLITLQALDRARRALAGEAADDSAPLRTGAGTHADPIAGTLPLVDLGDTRTGESTFSHYLPCINHATGRERVYRVELVQATTFDAYVIGAAGGTDVDLHVLGSLAESSCRATGDRAVSTTAGPGTIYIVVDSRTPASEGEYLLVVHAR
jgi:peptidoglycan/LPS O-acetylase OafA/YrhL